MIALPNRYIKGSSFPTTIIERNSIMDITPELPPMLQVVLFLALMAGLFVIGEIISHIGRGNK